MLTILQRAELTSEDIVFLMLGMLILSVVGIKFVPFFQKFDEVGWKVDVREIVNFIGKG